MINTDMNISEETKIEVGTKVVDLEEKDFDKVFPCPLCFKIHEFVVPCMEMLDVDFREELMNEFRIINELQETPI